MWKKQASSGSADEKVMDPGTADEKATDPGTAAEGYQPGQEVKVTLGDEEICGIILAIEQSGKVDVTINQPGYKLHGRVIKVDPEQLA